MQSYAIQSNTMQYLASLVTADGAYHCPVGSIIAIFYGQILNLVQYPLLPPETLLEMLDLLTEIVDELDWHPRELVLTHFDQLQLDVSVSQSQQIYNRGI